MGATIDWDGIEKAIADEISELEAIRKNMQQRRVDLARVAQMAREAQENESGALDYAKAQQEFLRLRDAMWGDLQLIGAGGGFGLRTLIHPEHFRIDDGKARMHEIVLPVDGADVLFCYSCCYTLGGGRAVMLMKEHEGERHVVTYWDGEQHTNIRHFDSRVAANGEFLEKHEPGGY